MKQKTKILVILSKKSGNDSDIKPQLLEFFSKHRVRTIYKNIDSPSDIPSIIEKNQNSLSLVLVYGGDGTIVVAIKALSDYDIPLIIVPGGTGNFIANYLEVPTSPTRLLRLYFANRYSTHLFDLSASGENLLALDIQVGWWAKSTLETTRDMKRRLGFLAYGIQAIRSLPSQNRKTYRFTLDSDKHIHEQYAYTAIFANKAVQNFFSYKLFNKPERQATLEIAFVKSINPIRFWIWVTSRFLTGRNISGFVETHYAHRVTLLEAPKEVLFDDMPARISFPYEIQAGKAQTKIIMPTYELSHSLVTKLILRINNLKFITFEQLRNEISGAPLYRYSQVLPNIYLGGAFRSKAKAEFESWGVTSIVNMRTTPDPDLGPKFRILHLATKDFYAPSNESIEQAIEYILSTVSRGEGVYVHCYHGRGRAPTIVAAYLMKIHGMTPRQAIDHLKLVRPMTYLSSRQRNQLETIWLIWKKNKRIDT